MRKALLAACAIIGLCGCAGPARAESQCSDPAYHGDCELQRVDKECLPQAYHGRHEQCMRSYVASHYSGDFISRHRDAIRILINGGVMLDRIDAGLPPTGEPQ
jgi:hypothetical protein